MSETLEQRIRAQAEKDPNLGSIIAYASDIVEIFEERDAELAALRAENERLKAAVEPFVTAYNEAGGCVPLDEEEQEEILFSIFNSTPLESFSRLAAALRGEA